MKSATPQMLPQPQRQLQPLQQPGRPPLNSPVSKMEELPPSARKAALPPREKASATSRGNQLKEIFRTIRKPALIIASLLTASWFLTSGGQETGSGNWRHHDHANSQWLATQQSADHEQKPMKWVHPMGPAHFGTIIPIGANDVDQKTTMAIQQELNNYGSSRSDEVNRILSEAQKDLADAAALEIPLDEAPAKPTLSDGMQLELAQDTSRFYQIYLWDSCYEDGDIVDIFIDRHRFATVPITNGGTTLTVPVKNNGSTQIAVQGIRDGGGGITVACRTSQGEGFVRVLESGETQVLAIAGPGASFSAAAGF
jgi:hypothetical protein